MREDLPSGTVTFVFTDVAGSTKLLQEHGATYADLLGAHRAVVRAALSRHAGVRSRPEDQDVGDELAELLLDDCGTRRG